MRTLSLTVIASVGIVVVALLVARSWLTPVVTTWSSGPTIEHLETLSDLICLRVHISDVLVGENDNVRGSWLVKGDAVLGIDLRQGKVIESDTARRQAKLKLPVPVVQSPRVDHERTRTWSVERLTWIPWKGDPDYLRDEAMRQAQRVIQRVTGSEENVDAAKKSAERLIREIYRMVGWEVAVEWSAATRP